MRSALGLVLLFAAGIADACPVGTPKSVVLTPPGTELAEGGGILVGQYVEFHGDRDPHGAESTWRFGDGSTPRIVNLAPALDVLVASGPVTRLDDVKHEKLLDVRRATVKPRALAAPAVKAVRFEAVATANRGHVTITAELDAAPPANALALVAFDKEGKVARSWGRVIGAKTAVAIYASGSCGQVPEGVTASRPGDEIRLAWVDASGRLSPLSPPVAVTAST